MRGPGTWLRRTRTGLLCASACLSLGAASHVLAGGQLPGVASTVGLFAALSIVCALLLGGRPRRFEATTIALGVVQFSLHFAFHSLSAGHDGGPGMASGQQAHHSMTGMGHVSPMHAGTDMAGMVHAGHAMTPAMTLAHGLATVGTALCVVYGERILRRLAALLLPSLSPGALPALPAVPERLRLAPAAPAAPRFGVLLARMCPRRGPPPAVSA
ncbi:hypothetical protein [Streptomyces sp. NPDC088762]|uniref:hypothetical protein n=1 Tax=Streptomyces sp. NPDC088762 TaxID=3365891 RepID=UPI00382C5FD8